MRGWGGSCAAKQYASLLAHKARGVSERRSIWFNCNPINRNIRASLHKYPLGAESSSNSLGVSSINHVPWDSESWTRESFNCIPRIGGNFREFHIWTCWENNNSGDGGGCCLCSAYSEITNNNPKAQQGRVGVAEIRMENWNLHRTGLWGRSVHFANDEDDDGDQRT